MILEDISNKKNSHLVSCSCDICGIEFKRIKKNLKDRILCKTCSSKENGKLQSRNKGKIQNNKTHKSFWISQGFSEEEASLKIKELRRTSKEYWLKEGLSEEEAENRARIKSKEANVLCIEHWIKRGFSEEEAKQKVKDNRKNSSDRSRGRDCSESSRYSIKFWIKHGFSEEEAKQKVLEIQHNIHKIRNNKKISDKNKEYFFNTGKSFFFVDFVIPKIRYALEYNGDYFHANPSRYDKDYFNKKIKMTAHEIWDRDISRYQTISNMGYKLDIVWESYDSDKEINRIVKNITNRFIFINRPA